ncbi:response regulator [Flammeovirga agarivorans]|uniref:Response regulator n=1 Tax=Flammeovirga agarivorans TaxID=2726742 RepID=A0A7X8SMJ0_9BACT|nr:response regulator [Flammeovirga agarivorans]NLR92872.1 response regulator [Flammeovirga agarivorans]
MNSTHLIYFIEDNTTENMLMKLALQKLPNIEAKFFSNGFKLLEAFEKEPAKIIVTDLMMPEISGQQIIHTLRKQSKETLVIVISAQEEVNQIADLQALGIFNYVVKGDHCLSYLKKTIEVACYLLDEGYQF